MVQEYAGPYGGTWSEQGGFAPGGYDPKLQDLWDYIRNQPTLSTMPYATGPMIDPFEEASRASTQIPRTLYQPIGPPPTPKVEQPEPEKQFFQNYQKFVEMGGRKATFVDEKGVTHTVSTKPAKQPVQTPQAAPQAAPQDQTGITQGTPWSGVLPSGPMETSLQGQDYGPEMIPGGGAPLAIQPNQIPYSEFYGAGKQPLSYDDMYRQQQAAINQAYGMSYKDRMRQAAQQDPRGKLRRIVDRLLTGDPWHDEKIAAHIAQYDQERAAQIVQHGFQNMHIKAQADIQDRTNSLNYMSEQIAQNPRLDQNDKFRRDYALAMGIPLSDVDTALAKSKDASGKYTFSLDPIEQKKQNLIRVANMYQDVYKLNPDLALAAAGNPAVRDKLLTDATEYYDTELAAAERSGNKDRIEAAKKKVEELRFIKSTKHLDFFQEQLAYLEKTREQSWRTPQTKALWLEAWVSAYEKAFNITRPSGKDAEAAYLDLRNKQLEAEKKILDLRTTQAAAPNFEDRLIRDTHSGFRAIKSEEARRGYYEESSRIRDLMKGRGKGSIDPKDKQQAEKYRKYVEGMLGVDIMKHLGGILEYDEASELIDQLTQWESSHPGQELPGSQIVYFINNLRKNRAAQKGKK